MTVDAALDTSINQTRAEGSYASAGRSVLYVNGRFLVQRQTGVQRFAREVLRAIDTLLREQRESETVSGRAWEGEVVLLTPAGIQAPSWLRNVRHLAAGIMGRGYAWEQFDLPRLSRGGVLLNLCNLAPLAKRQQVMVLHDATTRARPETFSRTFRLANAVLIPLLCRRAAELATVSAFSRAEISRWFRIPMSRLPVCYEGAEHVLASPADDKVLERNGLRGRPYFLAVGMGPVNKNLDLLLDAFRRSDIPGVSLVLTGSRSARVYGSSISKVPPGVIHVGHIEDAELRALYENALALVYPSSYEGFGLPPVEAMACGCPVIISDQAALLEVGRDSACVVEMNNASVLAAALAKVATDAAFRVVLSERGLMRARCFTWQATAQALLLQCRAAGAR